jgi:hypothetical protein
MLKRSIVLILVLFYSFSAYADAPLTPFKMQKVAASSVPKDIIIANLASITIDPSGNVFAFADCGKECFIIKFSPDLKYIKHFGSKGKGPGQFSTYFTPIDDRISVDQKGNIHVNDENPCRIVIFDNDGNYRKEEIFFSRLGFNSVSSPKVIENGKYVALSYNSEINNREGVVLNIKPPALNVLYSFNEKRITTKEGPTLVGTYYGSKYLYDKDSEHFAFANGQVFKFRVFDKNGQPIVDIEDKKRTTNSFSQSELEEIKKETGNSEEGKALFKTYYDKIKHAKHYIHSIKLDREKIYVFTVGDITIKDKYPVEVYNLKGKLKGTLIKKGTMPNRPDRIWNNFAFFIDRDNEDNPRIVKYRIMD